MKIESVNFKLHGMLRKLCYILEYPADWAIKILPILDETLKFHNVDVDDLDVFDFFALSIIVDDIDFNNERHNILLKDWKATLENTFRKFKKTKYKNFSDSQKKLSSLGLIAHASFDRNLFVVLLTPYFYSLKNPQIKKNDCYQDINL